LAAAAFFLIRFLLHRFGPQAATQQRMHLSPAGGAPSFDNAPAFGSGGAAAPVAREPSFATAHSLPAGFDAPAFERVAKLIFIRMQAANDAGNLDDLRQFATPEMFATFRLDLQDRQGAGQQTDVVQLNAQVLDFAQEAERQVVSVRFHGLIREEKDGATTPFDEIWHLVKPNDGSSEWAIAGIAQSDAA
ncbi:MAG TPA: Tim44-like domain-containing protein, partial [Rhizobacter sp.]|nr:Tim44-like domain-containing protein [Rhizobacter sp.]